MKSRKDTTKGIMFTKHRRTLTRTSAQCSPIWKDQENTIHETTTAFRAGNERSVQLRVSLLA
jgi:hypothetical protein